MYGLGDEMREMNSQLHELDDMVTELKQELKEKNTYIKSMEYALTYILDWYWKIEEPGNMPNKEELHGILKYINKVLKTRRRD
jgi:hypothetical protein